MNQNHRIELVRARLPPYEHPPPWVPPQQRDFHPDYNNDIREFLPRELILQRMRASEQLGFNIRGGQEHHCGIFVSKVMLNSEADKLGLREGDQAVKVLKMNTRIVMTVRFFPYGYDRTYDKCKFLASNQQAER